MTQASQNNKRGGRDNPYSVLDVVRGAHRTLEQVGNIWVEGEITSLSRPASGHLYFSLADDKISFPVVIWRTDATRLGFKVEQGMTLVCRGTLGIYERDGRFQMYAKFAEPKGAGAKALALKQLKDKLNKEGLFDAKYKKPLPLLPRSIGIATATRGAAVQDIIKTIGMRFPSHLICVDVNVQGAKAPASIVRGIQALDNYGVEVIIVGRGGGSDADLDAFNDERVVRAVAAANAVVISAVGHEVDTTLCDLVADSRAATPTMAGELAVPDRAELTKQLKHLQSRIVRETQSKLGKAKQDLDLFSERTQRLINTELDNRLRQWNKLEKRLSSAHPARRIAEWKSKFSDLESRLRTHSPSIFIANSKRQLAELKSRLDSELTEKVTAGTSRYKELIAKLEALSPLSVLARGFAIVRKESQLITSADQIEKGDRLEVSLADGEATAVIEKVAPRID